MTKDTPPRDEEAVRRYVEHMAMILDDLGVPRMPARVLMTMMVSDAPSLTASDLADLLEVSPAAISGAVRYLLHVTLIARLPEPGSRSYRYYLPDDLWYEAAFTRRPMLMSIADLSDEGAKALGGAATPSGRRVEEMTRFYRFINQELDGLMDRWQKYKAAAEEEDRESRPA